MGARRRQDSDKVTVIRFTDAILDGVSVEPIQAQLLQLVDQDGCRRMLLDFQDVQFVSSAAIGVLISLQKKLSAIDGMLVVCGLRREIAEVFEAVRLDEFLRICPDNSDMALTYFSDRSRSGLGKDVEHVVLRLGGTEEE